MLSLQPTGDALSKSMPESFCPPECYQVHFDIDQAPALQDWINGSKDPEALQSPGIAKAHGVRVVSLMGRLTSCCAANHKLPSLAGGVGWVE
jgi:hypothetical protein